jgi:hypothetical protein
LMICGGQFGTNRMYDGGAQERADAVTYQRWADSVVRFPRTSAMLAAISETWRRQAAEEDVSAELRKMER